jgi:general secretion pathway protein C
MGRTLSWLANIALFVLCCFFVANTANTVFAALLAPEATVVSATAQVAPAAARSWADREIILERNLFNASLLAPTPAPLEEEPEDLEKTQLPLALLGTAAAADPAASWAAVEDLEARKTLILKNGDPVSRGASVVRIERRRIVLLENGAHRELALDEDTAEAPAQAAARGPRRGGRSALAARERTPPQRDVANRVREIARNRFEVPREDVEAAVRNPASIFSQAQIQPKYEDGEMIGMQLNAIRPGSLFEEVGLESGDVITEFNGVAIDSPEASATIMTEFSQSAEFVLVVERADGPHTITFTLPEQE